MEDGTPLCIVARNVNICIIKKVYGTYEEEISNEDFQSLVNDEIHACKVFEKHNPDDIRLYQLDPMSNGYWYPFPFDDTAFYGSYKSDENGNV